MFPLDYRGEVEVTSFNKLNPVSYQEQLLTKASEKLKIAKASDIKTQDNKVSFRVSLFRLAGNWNILTQIDSGHIEILPSKNLAVSYFISFKRFFILGTLLVFIAGISIFPELPTSTIEKVLLLAAIWLFLVGLNLLMAIIRFPAFVESIVRETHNQTLNRNNKMCHKRPFLRLTPKVIGFKKAQFLFIIIPAS